MTTATKESAFVEVSPMLANGGASDSLWTNPKWWAEEKIDGSRYVMQITSQGVKFTSRRISSKTGVHVDKTENVPHLAFSHIPSELYGTIIDGEMQHDDFTQTVSIMGSSPDKARTKQIDKGWITYYAFDILQYQGACVRGLPQKNRRLLLENVVALLDNANIKLTDKVTENKEQYYLDIVARGGEGVILKHEDGEYFEGSRSKQWLKVKRYLTADVVIVRAEKPSHYYEGEHLDDWQYWESPDGNKSQIGIPNPAGLKEMGYKPISRQWFNGWVGSIVFGKYNSKGELNELGQTSGLSDADRIEMSKGSFPAEQFKLKDELIGTTIEIGAMERIKASGAYRHPRFIRLRPDKDPSECILEG